MTRLVTLISIILVCLAMPAAAQERRVALVIGNGAYQNAPRLRNPVADATAVAAALKRLGFEVTAGTDLDQRGMVTKLQAFGRSAAGADIAVVFYAGHAVQVAGQNWLLPVDARLEREQDMRYEALVAESLLDETSGVRHLRLLLLDSCRDNPFKARLAQQMGTRSVAIGRGLAPIEPGAGGNSLIVYATRADYTAEDGSGADSPFTTALLKHLETPGLEIELMIRRVHDTVLASTGGRQEPAMYGSLGGAEIYLAPGTAPRIPSTQSTGGSVPSPASVAPTQSDLAAWGALQYSRDPAGFEAFIKNFPDSTFRPYAENKLRALRRIPQEQQALVTSALPPATEGVISPDEAYRRGKEAADRKDYEAALPLLRQAADSGNAMAMTVIGFLYANGWGIREDYGEAIRWSRMAADHGEAKAMTLLGVMYHNGMGVPQDNAEALRWYHKGADRGDPAAMYNIAAAYNNGQGVQKDLAQARAWLQRAAAAGSEQARNWLATH